MFSVHCCLFVILLLVTSSTGVALFRNIFKREAPEASSDKCGKVDPFIAMKQDVKSFTSPDFPNNYPVDLDLCTWRIRTHPGNQIIVTILSIDVEFQRKCQYDYLVLYDGPDAKSPKVGQYCGKTPPPAFTSTTSEVFVTFHSDPEESSKGFEIGYQAIGDFDDLVDSEGSNDNDTVEVSSDEDDSTAKAIIGGGEEGNTEGPDSENEYSDGSLSYGSSLDKSDEDMDSQTVEEDGKCNQIWHNARQGNITSPGYPGQYPSEADCTIEINAPIGSNSRIDLTFYSFDLEDICVFDYIIIKNSSAEDADPIGKYCGNDVPSLIQSYSGQLIIKFISDPTDQRGGFYASFTTHESEIVDTGSSKQPDSMLEFSIEPMDSLELGEEELVEKNCEANKEGVAILWYKDDNLLLKGEEPEGMLISDDGKTLLIPSMEAKHEGNFRCEGRLPGISTIISPFSLHIANEYSQSDGSVGSPDYKEEDDSQEDSAQFLTVPIAANITEGGSHVFFCSTNESVNLYWEKDGRSLTYTDKIYRIFQANLLVSDARMADSGRYSCAAYSKQRSSVKLGEASAYLSVTSSLEVSDVCGIVSAPEVMADESTDSAEGRIVNGKTALKGSSPWMARLWTRSTMEHFCGGSLLNHRWVVTAAHCFKNVARPEEFEVRLGDHDTLFIENEEMAFRVSRFILHPDFNPRTFDRDIALIELERRVAVFSDYVKPICLPNVDSSEELLEPGETARVAGWGKIIEDGAYPRFLKELYIPIVSEDSCKRSTNDYVSDYMFCAGFSQASKGDTCAGDSGGPLAQKEDGKWYMTGIVSWGEGCAREGKYGFYTKVVQFNDWLMETMTK